MPFTAPTSSYPGLKLYLTEMYKYEPQYTLDELAIQGWNVALFVAGVKVAGENLTQANVIAQDKEAPLPSLPWLDRTCELGKLPDTPDMRRPIAVHSFRSRGKQVRARGQQGKGRVQLLRIDRREEGTGDAFAIRDSECHIAGP